jgi:hypothetical protein
MVVGSANWLPLFREALADVTRRADFGGHDVVQVSAS